MEGGGRGSHGGRVQHPYHFANKKKRKHRLCVANKIGKTTHYYHWIDNTSTTDREHICRIRYHKREKKIFFLHFAVSLSRHYSGEFMAL